MKRLRVGIALALSTTIATPGWAQTAPDALVRSTADRVLDVRRQDRCVPELRRLAAGRSWQNAGARQRDALVDALRRLACSIGSVTLDGGVRPADRAEVKAPQGGGSETTARSIVDRAGNPPGEVFCRRAPGVDAWKVHDVVVEGTSLVQTYRTAFGVDIARSGNDGLTE